MPRSVQLVIALVRPGKPVEDAYTESINGKLCDECLNEQWFVTTAQAQLVIENWRIEYSRTARSPI